MQKQYQMQNDRDVLRIITTLVSFVTKALAAPLEVLLHRGGTMGERSLGLPAAAAMPVIFFWPVLCEPVHDPRPMIVFLGVYLFMCFVHRIKIAVRIARGGPQPHSRATGTPRIMRFTRRMAENTVKCMVEPFLTFLVGGLTLAVNPPLGGYLMVAACGLFATNNLADAYERQRVLDMRDAYADQRRVAERFRDMGN